MKKFFVLVLVVSWLLAAWPPVWQNPRFPPQIKQAQAAHTLDTSAKAATLQTTNPATLSYTAGAGTTVLVVMLAHTQTSRTGGVPTYNGVAMTQVGSEVLNAQEVGAEMWYLINPPTGAAYTISVPNGGGIGIRIYAATFKAGAGNTSALDVSNSTNVDAANPSLTLTTTVNGAAVVGILADGLSTVPTARSHTLISNADEGQWVNEAQYALQANLGLITLSHTIAVDDVAMIVAAFKPVSLVTTLGNGASEPSSVTIAPGAGATDLDNFTLVTNSGTDTVTAATVTLGPANAYNNIAQVDITDDANTAKCTAVSGLTSNTVTFPASTCNIAVTTSSTNYKIRITPKTHANMPAVPGASYATTGTVTALTSTNTPVYNDSGSATVTVDNASPANVTAAAGTAGIEEVSLTWTNPGDSDFHSSVVLRRAGTAVGDTPVEGATYSIGNPVGSSTVACVVATPTAACTDTGLTGGTAYHYKIFAKDSNANYSQTGVVPTGSPFTPTAKVISVAVADGIITYGTMTTGEIKTTITLADTQTLTNDGNVSETFNIKGQNTVCPWTLAATAGSNLYVHQFCKTTDVSCASPPTGYTELTTTYTALYTGVAVSGTKQIDLRLIAPTVTSCGGQQNVDVTIQATQ